MLRLSAIIPLVYVSIVSSSEKTVINGDLSGSNPGYCANGFSELVRLDMTPMPAIMAGTKVNAQALGKIKGLGTLEAGKLADLVAEKGDPIKDIKELKKVRFVMKGR